MNQTDQNKYCHDGIVASNNRKKKMYFFYIFYYTMFKIHVDLGKSVE